MQNKQTNAREAYGPLLSSPSEEIIIYNAKEDWKIKYDDEEEQGKTQYKRLVVQMTKPHKIILPVTKDRHSSFLETQNDINFGLVKTCVKP